MELEISNISKQYQHGWLFKDISLSVKQGESIAITGKNGSGKSTLIKIIAGFTLPSSGTINFKRDLKQFTAENIFSQVSIVAPYQDLLESFTAEEHLKFHFKFKPQRTAFSYVEMLERSGLVNHDKQLKYYSSGMKQRLKLIMGLYSDTPILLLDEPSAFLDASGINWYKNEISEMRKTGRIIVVASNDEKEYDFVNRELKIKEYNKISGKEF